MNLDDELERVANQPVHRPSFDTVVERAHTIQRRRRITGGALATAAVLVLGAGALAISGTGEKDSTDLITELPDDNATPDTTGPTMPALPATGGVSTGPTIGVSEPMVVRFGEQRTWVSNRTELLALVDPETQEITRTVEAPHAVGWIAVGGGSIWAAHPDDDAVSRIDEQSGEVLWTSPIGASADGIAYGAGALWIGNPEEGTVSRIDPDTGDVVARIDVGGASSIVEVMDGQVWSSGQAILPQRVEPGVEIPLALSEERDGLVAHIDPSDNSVTLIPTGALMSGGFDADNGGLWLAEAATQSVVHIDPETDEVVAKIPVDGLPCCPNAGGRHVWVGGWKECGAPEGCTSLLFRIDPVSNELLETIEVPQVGMAAGTWAGEDAVYMSDFEGVLHPIEVEGGP